MVWQQFPLANGFADMNNIRIVIFCASCAMLAGVSRGGIFEDIANGNLKGLESVTNRPSVVNSRNADGETPLMFASRIGEVDCVKVLVVAGADTETTSKGFRAVDQVESYLRRTGDAGRQVLDVLRSDGFGEDTIRAFEKEMDALHGTPERIKAWREILAVLSRVDDEKRRQKRGQRAMVADAKRQLVNDVSWIQKAASNELRCARLALKEPPSSAPSERWSTNRVCYSMSLGKASRGDVQKWAQVVVGDRKSWISGITCRLADRGCRRIRFFPTGAVNVWIEELRASNRCLACKYDESGALKWMVRTSAGKVTGFWRMKDGLIYEDEDSLSAMRLVEHAMGEVGE